MFVIGKNDEKEATFKHSGKDCSLFTIHTSRPFRIVGKVVKSESTRTEKEKRY